MRASLPFRASYRRALGLQPGQQLVIVSSTWGDGSLLGSSQADVLRRSLAELPAEEFRTFSAIHPNAYYGHGAWQLKSWLAPLMDSGLLLPAPESEAWKAALCAADFLVGDHGSLTMYGVSLGIPCILGAFDDSKVAPGSPMERLGKLLPRVTNAYPLRPQLSAVKSQRDDPELLEVGQTVTSAPGRSAELLRRLFYSWLRLDEPEHPATVTAVPVPTRQSEHHARLVPHEEAMFVTATVTDGCRGPADGEVTVRRYPAARQRGQGRHLASAHLAADRDDPDRRWPRTADVLLVPQERVSGPGDDPWCAYQASFSGCGLVASEIMDQGCMAVLRGGRRMRVRWLRRPEWATFSLAASAVYAWTTRPGEREDEPYPGETPEQIVVRAGELPDSGLLEVSEVRAHARR
ncbi:hypothetical protein P8605_15510 [Streptomyces sp. T-3]|nr:hypothetical protein [Streptomyces sp. T-3]